MLMWAGTPHGKEALTRLDIDTADGRCDDRIALRCPVTLYQKSVNGRLRVVSAHVLNISSSGALAHASQPLTIGAYVRMRGNELLSGMAQVRHCSRHGFGFRIGLRFAMALPDRF